MLKYKEFYREHGIRLIRDFIDPIAWKSDIIKWPKNSLLIWGNFNNTIRIPTTEYGYFKTLTKPRVYVITEYPMHPTYGTVKQIPINARNIIKEFKKTEPEFRYIVSGAKITVPSSSEVMVCLGTVNKGYRYTPHPLNDYYMWGNTLTSEAKYATLNKTGVSRHKFIFMDIPYSIPKREYIYRHVGEPTRGTLKTFIDGTYLNILELFRFISDEYKDKSILANTIPEDEFKYVDLVLTINNKLIIVNLEVLASITDAYTIETKLKKYQSSTASKILYVFFNKLISTSAIEHKQAEMVDGLHKLVNIKDVSDSDIEETHIDSVIHDEIDIDKDVINVTDELTDDLTSEVSAIDTETILEDTSVDLSTINTTPPLIDNSSVLASIEELKNNKIVSKVVADNLTIALKEQDKKLSPYQDGSKLRDMLHYDPADVIIDPNSTTITDSPSILDKSGNNNMVAAINTKYIKKGLKKDILSTFYSIQKAGVVITDHDINVSRSVMGGVEEHTLSITTVTGNRSTVKIRLPIVEEDGSMIMGSKKYKMRSQRADIPLKKISNTIVSINSYYGKLFISKATYKKDDLGFWFHKQLIKLYNTTEFVKDVTTIPVVSHDADVPEHYGLISRYVKSFIYKDTLFNFDYTNRDKILGIEDISNYENNAVVIGVIKGKPIIMDYDNNLFIINGSDKEELGVIFDYLNIDMSKAPIEYCNVKIYKEQIPLGVILSYYIGYKKLIKYLNVKYEVIDTGKRYTMNNDQYRIIFKDKTYIITRDYGVNDLIMYGIASINKYTKSVTVSMLNNKSRFNALYTAMGLPILYINEIKLMENMYIDPITAQVLELFKLPTSFKGVLIKAADMLRDDNYKHPNSMEGSIIKGYERLSGMLYLELVKSLRINTNKSHFGKSRISISPYSIISRITEDSTVVLADDINPIAALKQDEDVTYLGLHGRKEETMSAKTRVMHPSEIGITSEAVKDSGAVGISSYLSASPNITTTRGTTSKLNKDNGWSSRLSTSAMLAPFGTKDDPKRLNFVSIMNGHVIDMKEMRAPYIRTGYESVVAVRSPDKYVISADEEGVVVSVSKDNIVVKYKTKGKAKYTFKEWTTKEESGVAYTHKQIPNLNKGDKFIKDDTLAYDPGFYEPDIFAPNRVIFKMGTYMTVALMEVTETYEDSGSISEKMAKRMGTSIVKVKSIIVNSTDTIFKPLSKNDTTEPKTPIMSIADKTLASVSDLDNKALDILKDLKMLTPKAGTRGIVNKIRVYYNCDLKDMTPSLRKLAKISDEEVLAEIGSTGQVDSSYSIKGKPLLDGEVEIKYFIKVNVGMGTGDKAVLGNQLKFTVGEVYTDPIVSENGEEVDCLFSTRAIEARIVNSPGLIGTTAMLLEKLTDKVVSEYFS